MNTPAAGAGNWTWRYHPDALHPDFAAKLTALMAMTDRDGYEAPVEGAEAGQPTDLASKRIALEAHPSRPPLHLESPSTQNSGATMPLSGEAIRTMNYVDDISVTLRRILTVLPSLTEEERQRIAEYIRVSEPNYDTVLNHITKG